jgi:hypothetical protein
MSQILDTIKGVPGNIAKLPTTIYNMATGSYYGVPVATFGLIGITSIALAYVTLMKDDDEKNTSDTGLNDNRKEYESSDEDEYQESNNMEEQREEPREESREESRDDLREGLREGPRQMNGGKKKKSIKKRGKKSKKTIKKNKK